MANVLEYLGNIRGPRGYSVEDAEVLEDGRLLLEISNGQVIDAGVVRGPQGLPGVNGLSNDAATAALFGTTSATQAAADARFTRKSLQPINAKDAPYNAKGDGVTDDTAAIQAALNAGTIVYLPPGQYVASGLVLASGHTLFGAGPNVTTIVHNLTDDGIKATGTSGTPLAGITVRDLGILSNRLNLNQRGFFFQYVDDSLIENVKISGTGNNGINWYTSKRSKVINTEITNSGNFGILFYRCADMVADNNDIHHFSTTQANLGIQFKSSKGCQAVGNRINNISGYGIYTWDDGLDLVNFPDRDHLISDNQIHDCVAGGTFAGTGIYINVTTGARVSRNTIRSCVAGGISVAAAVGAVIESNQVAGTSDVPGIGLSTGTKHSRVSGNMITGYGQGVFLDAAHNNRIVDNSVYNLMAAASGLSAGVRVRNASSNNTFFLNSVIDDQTTPTTKRGIYQESGNYNRFLFNIASGTTTGNYAVVGTNNVQIGNNSSLTDNPLPVGDATGKLGFFGAAPVVKPTGVTADAASVRTALITLGLIA